MVEADSAQIVLGPQGVALVLIAAAIYGGVIAALVELADRAWPQHGYTVFFVMAGVFGTVVLAGCWIGQAAATLVFWCFVASGAPNIIGAVVRNIRKARHQARADRELVDRFVGEADGDAEETLRLGRQ